MYLEILDSDVGERKTCARHVNPEDRQAKGIHVNADPLL